MNLDVPYERVLSTPKRWDGHWGATCDFQAGFYQCNYGLHERYSHELECFYLFCPKCGSAYPVREVKK